MLISPVQNVKADLQKIRDAALERHRRGEDAFKVVAGISAGVDGILTQLFTEYLRGEEENVALLAVGGYGRRELCPHSDIDILFLRQDDRGSEAIGKLVMLLWDGGIQLGHAVRTPEECLTFMEDDVTTANTMLESRFLAGSERLYGRFHVKALARYRRKRGEAFVRTKIGLLRQSIEDPQRTIYIVEPNVKEGMCGLRDIQRVLWIENLKSQGDTFEALLTQGRFSQNEVRRLKEAYAFYLRLRCELHFTNGVRQDILERDSVLTIAQNLGYARGSEDQEAVEKLMGDYYRHARAVYRFLRFYLQTDTRGRSLLERVSRWFRSKDVRPHLSLYKGRLYRSKTPPEGVTPELLLEIFAIAQEKNARVSEDLCGWIRRKLSNLEVDFSRRSDVLRGFRAILRGKHVGRVLKTMHATGLLDRILPEFGQINCLVNFDGHHQFTVDEHTLKTLEEMDRIEAEADYPEPEFREILYQIKDHLPLRLALLLHDLGKSIPGEHSVSGTEAAKLICERLGLEAKTIESVDFLIYHHLELFRVSELRDFSEPGVIESLARLVGSEERLTMLYLMTYLDVVSVGPGTWTRWKGAQLSELYQRTLIHLRQGSPPGENLEAVLNAAGLSDQDKSALVEHCKLVDNPAYAHEILPQRMLFHLSLVKKLRDLGEMQVEQESFLGYHEVTFCGGDRPRLFADLSGVLLSEGFNVLGARLYSRSDSVVIDLFQVEVADTVRLGVEERVSRIRKKLKKIEAGAESVEDLIRQRTRTYRDKRWSKPLFGPSVSIDNESSEACSLVEVRAGDRPGLLFDLATTLHRLNLDVRTAKVSTLTDRAHDVFYVAERSGKKVEGALRRAEVSQALVSVVQQPSVLNAAPK